MLKYRIKSYPIMKDCSLLTNPRTLNPESTHNWCGEYGGGGKWATCPFPPSGEVESTDGGGGGGEGEWTKLPAVGFGRTELSLRLLDIVS